MGKKKKAIVTTVIRYLIILIFCVPMIMPLLWMLTTALKDNAAVFAMPPQWIPKVFHWENFTIGLQQIEFWKRFGNTVFISVIVCFGQVCSCMSVGYALARLRFPGKKVWFYLIVGSMMIPGMVTVIPVFRLWAACGFYHGICRIGGRVFSRALRGDCGFLGLGERAAFHCRPKGTRRKSKFLRAAELWLV